MARRPLVKSRVTSNIPEFCNIFRETLESRPAITLRTTAQAMATEAREVVYRQRYNWKPLSPLYAKFKERRRLDPRTLIATKDYVSNIIWWEDNRGICHVGVDPNRIHIASGLPMRIIARIHEFGTPTIPMRPLWRPLFAKWVKSTPRLRLMMIRNVRRSAREAMRRRAL